MFKFRKEQYNDTTEVFMGLTQSDILDIQAYLDDTFDLSTESSLSNGDTIFNVTGLRAEQVDVALAKITQISGDRFEVLYNETSVGEGKVQAISVTSKNN